MSSRRWLAVLTCLAGLWGGESAAGPRTPTFEERVAAQRAIERVYWSHRIWPADNPGSKPAFEAVMTDEMLRARVGRYLDRSREVEQAFGLSISPSILQGEVERMAAKSRDPGMLRELFNALGDDPVLIAECLGRQVLAARLGESGTGPIPYVAVDKDFSLPALAPVDCTDDTWAPTPTDAPDARGQNATVWTGTEMIVVGSGSSTAARYNPATDTWTQVTEVGAPVTREYLSAVWTGSEMIVWGGYQSNVGDFSTGARYNPVSDSWVPTTTDGAPSPRRGHTAIWTGSEMIVWGGQAGNSVLGTGGRYDPSTDTWTPTSDTNAPSARTTHTAVWTGTQMIVWGGAATNTGALYTPATNTWTPTTSTSAPSARSNHSAVWTGSRMVIWGGTDSFGALNTGSRYDPDHDRWFAMTTAGAAPARGYHSAVWTGSRVVVWGGTNPNAGGSMNTGGRYDPTTDAWSATSTSGAPSKRYEHTAIWTGSQMIIWGAGLNTGGRYSPATDSWLPTSTGSEPSPRNGHAVAWTGAELFVWGGNSGEGIVQTGARYDPATDAWSPTSLAGAPLARHNHTAVWTGSRVVVWGGDNPAFPGGYLNTGGRYDPSTDTWSSTSTTNAPTGRNLHTAIWTGTQMVVWGGNDSTGPPVPYASTGGRYDPSADSWLATNTAGAPTGRTFHTAVWTGSEMLVWGGQLSNPFGTTATGSRYNPSTDSWSAMTLFNAPSARAGHAAVWTGSLMLIWGGAYNGGRYRPATNSWDGLIANDGLPVHSAGLTVWNGVEMISWSGNNADGSGQPNTGARYNPSANTWRLMSTVGAPFGRFEAKGAWSSTAMIMWGGGIQTSSGGVYCACHVPATRYRDLDGDGYGSLSQAFTMCGDATTPGFVANAADCNDGNAAVHPGVAEMCGDGLDNDCNGLTDDPQIPTVVPVLKVDKSGAAAAVSWAPHPNAAFYDVQRGSLATLRASAGDFTPATQGCLADNLAATSIEDATAAPSDDGFWYLARGTSCGGSGSYDDGSASQSGLRDAEIAASAAACP